MAEARILSDYESIDEQPISVVKHDEQPPQPQKKPRTLKTSVFHLLMYIIVGFITFGSIFSVIHMQNNVTSLSTSIMEQQQKNETLNTKVEELQQEKNELSRAERIMKIAKAAGLSVNDNNIRKVMK